MTLTPDRTPKKPKRHAPTPSQNAPGPDETSTNSRRTPAADGPRDEAISEELQSLRDQLAQAGFDLTGHPLADDFDALDPVTTNAPVPEDPAFDYFSTIDDSDIDLFGPRRDNGGEEADEWPGDAPSQDPEHPIPDDTAHPGDLPATARNGQSQSVPSTPANSTNTPGPFASGSSIPQSPDDSTTSVPVGTPTTDTSETVGTGTVETADAPGWVSRHPLLTDTAWADLSGFAPEVTTSITTLMDFSTGLRFFDRPMGPDEALLLIDGTEALSRITEALSTLALSVYERVGTPTDTGAKDTKALIRDRLNLTPTEANRRTELAKNLGGRVDTTGQALQPLCPEVAEGLHAGVLSAGQAKAIDDCLDDLPGWVSAEQRADVEKRLVDYAPQVRVKDLRGIFDRMLAYIDPDGAKPCEETPRTDYSVTVRPKRNGDWVLGGLLDPVSGAALNGLLTSRIHSATPDTDANGHNSGTTGDTGVDSEDAGGTSLGHPATPSGSNDTAADQDALFEIVDQVLHGDLHDAPLPIPQAPPDWAVGSGDDGDETGRGTDSTAAGVGATDSAAAGFPVGVGVREDGTPVDLTGQRPSARAWIYERFATLISRISMDQAGTGSPYALVVTATAEDLAHRTGEGTTGVETPIPIHELVTNGLNGDVFFHLMSETAHTMQVMTEKRFANKKQVAVITARDKGCTFPGCDAPPGWCEANHVVPWARGGKTTINNLALACSAHHHLLDRSDWEMLMLLDGRPAWRPPASVDPARRPLLHPRFLAEEIIASLFDDHPDSSDENQSVEGDCPG
ncbi:HNH endonuclease [Brevibacterium casei CIP 102111]|uniref:HNH endonuclease n=2 Tax=Brevibacterium casei TaxID=33889 RepID=A0A2H1HJR1_9MICO|nr:HNH endonuclease signature motif containing protein [Brevibacterium casei]SMX63172.1 HNH endonuclease [Brevibacterium casei CIP 102111]